MAFYDYSETFPEGYPRREICDASMHNIYRASDTGFFLPRNANINLLQIFT